MRLFSLERIEEIQKLLREIFELDLLYNLDMHRLEIYAGILQQVVRKLIIYVTKKSKKSFYEQTINLDLVSIMSLSMILIRIVFLN